MEKKSLMIIAGIIMSGIALAGYFVHEGFKFVSIISVISFLIIISIFFMVNKKHEKLQTVQKDELTFHVSLKSFRNAYFSVFILMFIVNIFYNFNLVSLKVESFIFYIYAVSLTTFFVSRYFYMKRLSAE